MIPKIVYYTWVSDKPLPGEFNKYLDTWREIMPDYEIRPISLSNVIRNDFVDKSISIGKYALAGHFGRCERLYETGGIYFDIDIQAVKRFDDLLDSKMILGIEDAKSVNNAVIVSEAGHPFLKKCMDYMSAFDPGNDQAELKTGPWMFTELMKQEGWSEGGIGRFNDIDIVPPEYFYPFHYTKTFTPECITDKTYTVHWWANTWSK